MIEILYIITMYITLRLFERVAQVFNSSSIHSHAKNFSHQRVVVQYQYLEDSSSKCWGMPGNRCNSFTNYGGKSELYPVSINRLRMGTVPDNIRGE